MSSWGWWRLSCEWIYLSADGSDHYRAAYQHQERLIFFPPYTPPLPSCLKKEKKLFSWASTDLLLLVLPWEAFEEFWKQNGEGLLPITLRGGSNSSISSGFVSFPLPTNPPERKIQVYLKTPERLLNYPFIYVHWVNLLNYLFIHVHWVKSTKELWNSSWVQISRLKGCIMLSWFHTPWWHHNENDLFGVCCVLNKDCVNFPCFNSSHPSEKKNLFLILGIKTGFHSYCCLVWGPWALNFILCPPHCQAPEHGQVWPR